MESVLRIYGHLGGGILCTGLARGNGKKAVNPATGGAVMTFLVLVFFTSGVLESFGPTLRGMGLGEGPAVGPVSAFDGKVGRGRRGEGVGRVPGHGVRDGALLGRLALAVLAVLPHGEGGEDGRGGDVEEGDVDRGVEIGEDTCDSQRAPKMFNVHCDVVVGNGELPRGLNSMTPIFS
jgi:hypothetical protein